MKKDETYNYQFVLDRTYDYGGATDNGIIANPNGADGLLTATNAPSFANYPSIQAYVTGFTDITAGTTTTTGETIAAATTNRTGW